jgi:hypothetical protein
MKIWGMLAAVPLALIASQALAVSWITVATDEDGIQTRVDKDSIRRGSDGFVYFSDDEDVMGRGDLAVDCQQRMIYTLKDEEYDFPDWRNHGQTVKPGSFGETELQYACANAG